MQNSSETMASVSSKGEAKVSLPSFVRTPITKKQKEVLDSENKCYYHR